MEKQSRQPGLYSPSFEHDNCGIGAVVSIKGIKTHQTVSDALSIVENLEHRAGKDAEGKTGDGVGILLQISHKFFKKAVKPLGIQIGDEREYGVGMFFFPQDELQKNQAKKMFEIILEKDLFVISDEIYSELTYAKEDHVSIASLPGMKERTVLINGFSKAFAMTGWRLGYACAPEVILKQMLKIHQYAIMCAPTTSQYAAVEALRNGDEDVQHMRESYDQRRRFLINAFEEMHLDCFEPQGAFYMFPSIKRFGMTSEEFATRLLREEKVAVVPGTAFGDCGEGFLRVSYAYSLKSLKEALSRIKRFVDRLDGKTE